MHRARKTQVQFWTSVSAILIVTLALVLWVVSNQKDLTLHASKLTRATRTLQEKMTDYRDQRLVFKDAPPDGRTIIVPRAEGEPLEAWIRRAHRMATDRKWTGPGVFESKTTTWVHDGLTIELVTDRLPEESEDEWCKRHDEAVARAKIAFPPDGR